MINTYMAATEDIKYLEGMANRLNYYKGYDVPHIGLDDSTILFGSVSEMAKILKKIAEAFKEKYPEAIEGHAQETFIPY